MSNIDDILDAILVAEGGGTETNDPTDQGGRTRYGISEKSNPDAWRSGPPSEEQARAIYRQRYVERPGFTRIVDPRLQHLLVDWGVMSGPIIAIRELQRAVGVEVDGVLGPATAKAANERDSRELVNALVIARVKMLGRIVQKDKSQAKFLSGWLNRVLDFFIV